MIGTKKHLVGKSIILVIIISFFLKNCKENENQDLSSLLDLKNYTLNKVKVNDSIIKIVGKNKDYKINGLYNSKSSEKIDKVSFQYITGDTIKKMRINQGNVECKFENGCYQCQIPITDNENAISGIAGIFTSKKNKEETTLGNTNIYITTKKWIFIIV